MKVRTSSVDETRALGGALAPLLRPGDLVLLAGGLGAGKTAFAQGIAAGLGVADPVVSPSFTIVREYEARIPLAHVDVYRLGRMQDLHDLGFDELLGGDRVVLVEWGDAVAQALPGDRLEVRLEPGSTDDERVVSLAPRGPTWRERAKALHAAVSCFDHTRVEGPRVDVACDGEG